MTNISETIFNDALNYLTASEKSESTAVDTSQKLLPPPLTDAVEELSKKYFVDPEQITSLIRGSILSIIRKKQKLKFDPANHLPATAATERYEPDSSDYITALHQASSAIAKLHVTNTFKIILSSEAFQQATKTYANHEQRYLSDPNNYDFDIDSVSDRFYHNLAEKEQLNPALVADSILDQRETELNSLPDFSIISRPVEFALQNIADKTNIPLNRLKDEYHRLHSYYTISDWYDLADRHFNTHAYTTPPYLNGRSKQLQYAHYQEKITLEKLREVLLSRNTKHDEEQLRYNVDGQKGLDYLDSPANTSLASFKTARTPIYQAFKAQGVSDDMLQQGLNAAHEWCRRGFVDKIEIDKKVLDNLTASPEEHFYSDWYNIKDFFYKTYLRFAPEDNYENTRKINIINEADRISNARGGAAITENFGNIMNDPFINITPLLPILRKTAPMVAATASLGSGVTNITAQDEKDYIKQRRGYYQSKVNTDRFNDTTNHIEDYIKPIINSGINHQLPEINPYNTSESILNTGKDLLQADKSVFPTSHLQITSPVYTSHEYENNKEANRRQELQSIFNEPENILDYNSNNN